MPQRANVPAIRCWLSTTLLISVVGLVPALPALAQASPSQKAPAGAPKSLLPDDFPDPEPPAPNAVEGAVVAVPSAAPAPLSGFEPLPPSEAPLAEQPEPEPRDPLAELAGPTRQPERAGLLIEANGGMGLDLFAGSDARFLSAMMSRIDAPLASRWGQILLQRALLTMADAPGPLNPADWVASRALTLVRLGAAADAHRMVSRIAIDRYTRLLYSAALQASVAAGDPMALCPLSPLAPTVTDSNSWALADAMCLSILGDEVGASALFDRLRRANLVSAFDIGLAERVASATGGSRRGSNLEWDEAGGGLTAWRIGLAGAAGLEIPAELLAAAPVGQKAWYVRLPGPSLESRARFAPEAAATGAISSAELNRILAAETDGLADSAAGESPGGKLRTANLAPNMAGRIAAMKELWSEAPATSLAAYGWKVATAAAASRISPSSALAEDAAALVASLLAAGIVPSAENWWQAVAEAEPAARTGVWALLAPVSTAVPAEKSLFDDWASTVSPHRAQLLAAGLEGLGRGSIGPQLAPVVNDWTRALDRAVAQRRVGEVILIAAIGLKGSWAEVPPDYLRRIARALVAVGHPAEAMLIVSEAADRS